MSNSKKRTGKFYSWDIINDNIAIKKIDRSVFEYNDTGIPEDTKWFWGVTDFDRNEKLSIEIFFRGIKYLSYIQFDKRNSAKLNWYADFGNELKRVCSYTKDINFYLSLVFIKIGENKFSVKLLEGDVGEISRMQVSNAKERLEGRKIVVSSVRVERNDKNRKACIEHHGLTCSACGFNFEETYGDLGRGFIEVHHIVPLSKFLEEKPVDPANELAPLCSNCHRMIHRQRDHVLMVEDLKKIMISAHSAVLR